VQITTQEYGRSNGTDFEVKEWGFAVRSITKQTALDQRLDSMEGVIVSGVRGGSPADEAGLLPGDVVRLVDGVRPSDLEQFRAAYQERLDAKKNRVMLQVRRRDSGRFVLLKLSPSKGEGS